MRKERQTIDRDVSSEDLSPASSEASPLATLENRDLAALLRQALQTLPESLRIAVLLRDIQELSYLEIAERLRLPEGTVKSRINRGRKELARQILRLREEADGRRVAWAATGQRPVGSARMNLTIARTGDVTLVRVGEARLMYPLLSDFAGSVSSLLTAGDKKVVVDLFGGELHRQRQHRLPHGSLPAGQRRRRAPEALPASRSASRPCSR